MKNKNIKKLLTYNRTIKNNNKNTSYTKEIDF